MESQQLFDPNFNIKLGAINLLGMLIIGAAGGHKKEWSQENKNRFLKGQIYQLIPSAIFFLNGLVNFRFSSLITLLALAGDALFVMPLYGLAWNDGKFTTQRLMPFGGVSLMAACALMII